MEQYYPRFERRISARISADVGDVQVKRHHCTTFLSDHFQPLLRRRGMAWLPSPPRMPRYNGGCEAGNGSLRKRTEHFARRAGRWTSGCLQAATAQANELLRPHGHRGPTHRACRSARQPINSPRRERFTAAIECHRQAILRERQDKFRCENKNHQRQVQRQAVFRALLELDLLTITRRSIPLQINPIKWAKLS